MDTSVFSWIPLGEIEPAIALLDSELLLAGLFFAATAVLIALCVPGILLPMALSSGALLGPLGASAVVVLGAAVGSQIFFLSARHFLGDRVRGRLGDRLLSFEQRFAVQGLWYVIALRVIGAPHFLVTAASALTPIRPAKFALATMLGFLPAVALAAATGSAI